MTTTNPAATDSANEWARVAKNLRYIIEHERERMSTTREEWLIEAANLIERQASAPDDVAQRIRQCANDLDTQDEATVRDELYRIADSLPASAPNDAIDAETLSIANAVVDWFVGAPKQRERPTRGQCAEAVRKLISAVSVSAPRGEAVAWRIKFSDGSAREWQRIEIPPEKSAFQRYVGATIEYAYASPPAAAQPIKVTAQSLDAACQAFTKTQDGVIPLNFVDCIRAAIEAALSAGRHNID